MMKRFLPNLAAAGVALVLVPACIARMRTPYTRPALPPAPTWSAEPASPSAIPGCWWEAFGDPSLNALVVHVTTRDRDLLAAAFRVRRAELEAARAVQALRPQFSGAAESQYSQPLTSTRLGSGASSSSLSANVAYEVDLFGRLDAQRDATAFEALATADDLDSTRFAVIGTVLETYWRLASTNERIAIGEDSLRYAQITQALVETQYRAGAVSALERRDVQQTVETQIAAQAALQQSRMVLRQTLTVLGNGDSPPIAEPQRLAASRLPQVDAGVPATLLARRPDLRAAEWRLRRTLAEVDATRASFYPAFSLTGALGTTSAALLGLVGNPVATVGAGLTLPFLNARDRRLRIAVSATHYDEAVTAFQRALLRAYAEVAEALSARTAYTLQGASLREALAAATDVEQLTERRYRAGVIPLRTWLDAQERRRTAQAALLDNQLAQLLNQSTLYRALGGATTYTSCRAPDLIQRPDGM